jgi:hypothetical protein
MKKNSDLLKNLHKTISACSKKNRKIFEEELETMSKKIEGMINQSKLDDKNDFLEQLNTPFENIHLQISLLNKKIEKILTTLSVEAKNSLNEIYTSLRNLDEIKEEVFRRELEKTKEMDLIRKKIVKSLKKDKNEIKKSIKKYKWADL